MNKVYKHQTYLTLYATLGQDITGATVKIDYIKPSTFRGSFDAEIINASTGEVKYVVLSEDDIDEYGEWTFYANCIFADGRKAYGEPYKQYIYRPGM